jgi:hypothetical protein
MEVIKRLNVGEFDEVEIGLGCAFAFGLLLFFYLFIFCYGVLRFLSNVYLGVYNIMVA